MEGQEIFFFISILDFILAFERKTEEKSQINVFFSIMEVLRPM